jgi:membrane protease YdiL (CAAX protease family)
MGGVAEACVFLGAVLGYLWFLVIPLPWTGVVLLAAVGFSWRRRALGIAALGLGWKDLAVSLRAWRALWIVSTLAFVALGYRFVFRWSAIEGGLVYLAWSAAQQLVYQSMTYMPLRRQLRKAVLAAVLAGLAFALVHAPNPVLLPATLVWGIVSSLLFERCRSVWGLALMQVMLSSMLLWVTPPELHKGFRIGPYYYNGSTGTFAPPIETPLPGR